MAPRAQADSRDLRESERFPKRYQYGITAQLLRAIASVPTNLAEGSKCESNAEFARFIQISERSLAESQYLLFLHRDLGSLEERRERAYQKEAAGIARQLHALKEVVPSEQQQISA